jgi:hypothetical protein
MKMICSGCKQPTQDYYMLKDGVWQSIARSRERYLCLSCVAQRLGRTIAREDFAEYPINFIFGHLPLEETTREFRESDVYPWWAGPPEKLLALLDEIKKDPPTDGIQKELYDWLQLQAQSLEGRV